MEQTVIRVPASGTVVQLDDGTSFPLNLVAAARFINEIRKKCDDEGLKNFEYLDLFGAWVAERSGARLESDQALELIDQIGEVLANRGKARRREPGPNSESSTQPPP